MTIRWIRRYRIILGDQAVVFTVVWISFILRLGVESLSEFSSQLWLMLMLALTIKPVTFQVMGVYRIYWKYAGEKEYLKMLLVSFLATVVLFLIILVLPPSQFPRSVIVIDWTLSSVIFMIYRKVAYVFSRSEYDWE